MALDYIVGVDEAGRGPLAGPVFAAAVVLDPQQPIAGLRDSKLLSAKKRDNLYKLIVQHALCYGIAYATVEEIDQRNILQASLLAMQRAVAQLVVAPISKVLVDGKHCPLLPYPAEAVVHGDQHCPAISAASILAKVSRDRVMDELHEQFPQYGFAQHKGYPTKAHIAALRAHGVSPVHRRSFAPVSHIL